VGDADVSLQFYMAAMPAMKMPEMKNTIPLKHVKNGVYSGTGSVMMAGSWDVTVSVKRGGKEVASKKLPLVAK
jgi:Cu(I)/Ag(I) efflux system membrane fusion protein/cobalt-zinc-cadmium efflux system membrane fusion protein